MTKNLLILWILICAAVLATGLAVEAGPEGQTLDPPVGQMMPMRGMMQRMMPDLVPPGIEPESLPAPDSRGAMLVVQYCWQCHNLPSPNMHAAAEWPQIAERMYIRAERMSGMMGIEVPTSQDEDTLVSYLKAHAMKSVPADSLPAPASPNVALFKEYCAQCHALPDPRSHTASAWPTVIQKMETNMQLMHKQTMTAAQQKQILEYLEQNAKSP